MPNTLSRLLAAMVLSVLTLGVLPAPAQRLATLETPRFRMMHEKKHAALAGEILEIAEKVWPTLAKAYESYEHYERIDILILDASDDANGFAIYPWSQVAIFAPHMDWVLRNRQIWLRNVVTHELAHVFSLRRAARLAPFDYVILNGSTYNARAGINFNFSVPWVPLIAPNWWIEGIAQFEAEQNGNDTYDSQRDMLLRDAWLTGTLPTLDFIETFDRSEDWTQGERVYNTGYAFLRYLRDRFGADKVRRLAFHKPLFNFSSSVEAAFGQSLPELFDAFKKSLAERYASFKDLPVDPVADPAMPGNFQQNLVFSSDGKYQAWLGNDDSRRAPMNWIYWKPVAKGGEVRKSGAPATVPAPAPSATPPAPGPEPEPQGEPAPEPQPEGMSGISSPPGSPFRGIGGFRAANPTLETGVRNLARIKGPGRGPLSQARVVKRAHREVDRSEELGSEGLEFNRENNRLLTTRQDWRYASYTDIWEYEFKARKSEKDKWHRLTWEERASYPSYHPTEKKIVYVRKKAGSTNLAVLDSTGRIRQLTNFSQGQQVYNPRFTSRGDSIYFTLQVEDREAIAAIPSDVPAFDPFLALKDTAAAFPDSLNLARGGNLTLVTPLRLGAIRHLRFHGDTLLWSSNMEDTAQPVYNVYARLPGRSQVMRATRVRTQAMEPLLHEGTLYYQGFQRQRFLTFKRPLVLSPTEDTLAATVDSVSLAKPKKVDFSKAFETGEYGSPRIAHEIVPYLSLQPQFLEGDRSYTDLAVGLQVNLGDPLGNWSQTFSGDVSKRLDWRTPLNYQLTYSGFLSGPAIRHTRLTWPLNLLYSLRHDIIQVEDTDAAQFQQGPATIDIKAYYSTIFTRDFANAYFPLPYDFYLDGGFFRQLVSQNLTQVADIDDGSGQIVRQRLDNLRLFDRAQQHRHFQSGVNWSHAWSKLGTYRPTYAQVWGSARKWWATYMTDVIPADSALIRAISQEGRPAPEAIFTHSQFDPWSLDAGLNFAWSHKQSLTLFAAAQGGAFLNKFPMEAVPGDLAGPNAVKEEPFGTLWVMNYQLGYYLMPGYPYNFRYRGRDIMEGTSLGLFTAGIELPVRGLGAFIPGLPLSSFREFSLRGWANAGTTLIVPFDKIGDFLLDGRHDLLVDLNVRAAANFRIYHQYPFTIYAQGSLPHNYLDEDRLFWYDYAHTGAPNPDGSPSAQQIANAPADRKRHMDLVKVPRFYVGFTLGY